MVFKWIKVKKYFLAIKIQLPAEQRRYCEKQMLVILIFLLFGDSFKWGNLFGITEYNWIQGHFSDIGLSAQFTTAIYYLSGHKSWGKYISTFVPIVALTSFELLQYPKTDPVDIFCYFLGSFAAISSILLYKYGFNNLSG